jgi:hypothetical protein
MALFCRMSYGIGDYSKRWQNAAAQYGSSCSALVIAGTAQLNAKLITDGFAASDDKPYGR